jgi:uncharacterized surface protein with fasciclin (FAS1) repeats
MIRTKFSRGIMLLAALSLVLAACGTDTEDPTAAPTTDPAPAATEPMDEPTDAAMGSSAEACDADALVAQVQGGPADGTLEGMTGDPVGTAAGNNPVLTTLATAVGAAGLGDTLNQAEALTVFAPTDCAFAQMDPATLEAALADPEGLLTTVLGFHVIAGQQLSGADLADVTELETFTGEILEVSAEGDTVTIGGGQATVVVPDIQTANATVHLIDTVMIPPSVSEGMDDADAGMETEGTDTAANTEGLACTTEELVDAVESGPEEGTLAGMTTDPVGTAASNNPVLTTLVTAASAAGLVDTLNGAEALTVFAPTDCAFAEMDPATLEAALADPEGLLTTVLGFHVIPQRLSPAELADMDSLETFTGETLEISGDADSLSVGGGQANVLVPDIQTANATVYLIDTVMIPPSVG